MTKMHLHVVILVSSGALYTAIKGVVVGSTLLYTTAVEARSLIGKKWPQQTKDLNDKCFMQIFNEHALADETAITKM